jgi:hypothetical protein
VVLLSAPKVRSPGSQQVQRKFHLMNDLQENGERKTWESVEGSWVPLMG